MHREESAPGLGPPPMPERRRVGYEKRGGWDGHGNENKVEKAQVGLSGGDRKRRD